MVFVFAVTPQKVLIRFSQELVRRYTKIHTVLTSRQTQSDQRLQAADSKAADLGSCSPC